jgi:hypothetical protein
MIIGGAQVGRHRLGRDLGGLGIVELKLNGFVRGGPNTQNRRARVHRAGPFSLSSPTSWIAGRQPRVNTRNPRARKAMTIQVTVCGSPLPQRPQKNNLC